MSRWTFIRMILHIIVPLYRLVIWLRNTLFDLGVLPVTKFPLPVISVGNISVGGTGKTPFTIWLANRLRSDFRCIVIISRGYGRREKGVRVVSDGAGNILDATRGGDEPVLIAQRLPEIPVVVAEKRKAGIQKAIDTFQPDLIILDDAFQHRFVARDCDIVLIDSRTDPETEVLLPAGRLREPLKNLKRATLVLYTHSDPPANNPDMTGWGNYFSGPVGYSTHDVGYFVDRRMQYFASVHDLKGMEVTSFAGIADPENFRQALEKAGLILKSFAALPDHHIYDNAWLRDFIKETREMNCRYVITTEKDLVKLPMDILQAMPVLALRLNITVYEPEKLLQTIKRCIDNRVIHS